jgi:phage terminase large subunit-like protein
MRAGPKAEVTAPPLDLSALPPSGGARVVAFCETFLHVPKGIGARQPLRLRPWQVEIVCGLFDAPRPRQGLVSIPRGNGKSTLAAALGLYGLFADGVEGAQVLCVASDERQARIVFNAARRMIELEPLLDERCQVFQSRQCTSTCVSVHRFAVPGHHSSPSGRTRRITAGIRPIGRCGCSAAAPR